MFPHRSRVFVDESKSRGYYLAAAAAAMGNVASIESRLRRLRAGRRSSIHFNDEGNRRDALLREFVLLDVHIRIYVMRGARDTVARPALLRALVDDLVKSRASHLTLERDASVEQADRRIIFDQLRIRNATRELEYQHRERREQPMLWLADAAAWCFQAAGGWPDKISPIVEDVVEIRAP